MTKSRRLAAVMILVMVALALPGAPANAAPGDVEAHVFLQNLTLAADGDAVEEHLGALLFSNTPGWADRVTLSIDTSAVQVADVNVTDATCSTGPIVRCVLPGPHQVFKHPGNDTIGFVTNAMVLISLTPRHGVPVGDTGTLTVAAKADDGPTTTETVTIRIGQGVDLTAVDEPPQSVTPGGAVTLQPRVRNSGPTAVDGLTAVINADDAVLADTDFGNCTYGYAIACTFDTTMTAGDTYRVSAPFTLWTPRDAAAGSQTSLSVQWLTAAEWQDWQADYGDLPDGRDGTGPDLGLSEVSASVAAVPQADTDHDDNGSYTTVSVTGARRTDVVALGAAVAGSPGDVQTINVGLVNQGPGTLRYPPFINNLAAVHVALPAGVSVVTADERCRSLFDDLPDPPPSTPADTPDTYNPPEYDCTPRSVVLRPGQILTFTFAIGITRAGHVDEGSVEFYLFGEDGVDRDPRNNRAPITVSVGGGEGGLPVTGTIAASAASAGLLLVLFGAAVIVALRRRTRRPA